MKTSINLTARLPDALEKCLTAQAKEATSSDGVNLPTDTTEALLDDIVATADSPPELRHCGCNRYRRLLSRAKAVIEAPQRQFAAYRPSEGNPGFLRRTEHRRGLPHELQDYLERQALRHNRDFEERNHHRTLSLSVTLKEQLERRLGVDEARKRIVAITDAQRGALRRLATEEGYKTFVIADNVGGRFSVLTPVGLLPIAVAGFDIRALIDGAAEMEKMTNTADASNPSYLYAETRNALYLAGKRPRFLSTTIPSSTSSANGGNSSTAKAKARTTLVSSLPQSTIQLTSIQWDSGFRKVSAPFSRL